MMGKVKKRARQSASFTVSVVQSSGRFWVIVPHVVSPNDTYPASPNIRNMPVMVVNPKVSVDRNCAAQP